MRWDHLFDDLESQLELELGAEELDLAAEEERLRLSRLTLRDRLVPLVRTTDEPLRLGLRNGETIDLALTASGRDWVAGDLAGARSGGATGAVVPLLGIAYVIPTARQLGVGIRPEPPTEPVGSLVARLGIAFVLRDLCRRRLPVELVGAVGSAHGTVDRVGRDHLDLAEHEPGVPRRASAVRRTRIVPLAEIVLIRF